MKIKFSIIDAGARYGIHPSWDDVRNLANFYLFEIDEIECRRLKKKYKNDKNIFVFPKALYSSNKELKFQVRKHEALNSIYSINKNFINSEQYKKNQFRLINEKKIKAYTIDYLFKNRDIHFLKLDVEGAELEVLEGAKKKLSSSILGIRSEVAFSNVFNNIPMIGEINNYLISKDFQLINLDYSGKGNKFGKFTLPNKFGQLITTDAIWTINNERLFSFKGDLLTINVLRVAIFLFLNNATDLAIDLLLKVVRKKGVSFKRFQKDPLFKLLDKKVLLLLKSLLNYPMFSNKEIKDVYETIFYKKFPELNKFYQSDIFK